MVVLVIFLMSMFFSLAVGVMSGLSDVRRLKIPNVNSVYVIVAFFVAYVTLWVSGTQGVMASPVSHLLSALVTFAITAVLFAMGLLGAGDSKFGTACALWIGVKYLPIFLFFMTLFGGLLGAVTLVIKKKKPFATPMKGGWIDQAQNGADKVPYGVAITFGMLIAFIYAGYFSPEVLSSFLAQGEVEGAS